MTLARLVADTDRRVRQRVERPDLAGLDVRAARLGLTPSSCPALVAAVDERPVSQRDLLAVRDALAEPGLTPGDGALERWLLLHAGLAALPRLERLRVTPHVKALICGELSHVAEADAHAMSRMALGTSRFVGMAKELTLRRFPAGQFDWEVSGVPRSAVLRVRPRDLPKTLWLLGWRMGGVGPIFFSHLNPRRRHRSLREDEANQSYFHMAGAMALQPEIRGFAACSWFRSPATHAVSPHLAWLSRVFTAHGGLVVEAGRADPDEGVLHASATRRRLYEAGEFRPTLGLVLWPRQAMLSWAAAHPELGSGAASQTGFG